MANNLTVIKNELTKPETSKDIAIALGIDPLDEKSLNKAAKYAYGVLSTIEASVGSKADLSGCNAASVKATMIEAANRGVYIDGRQHAHLVKYGNKCTFQMGFRGYLVKIKEYYNDADFVVQAVYEGDKVKQWNTDGEQHYSIEQSGSFRSGEKGLKGILVAITYTDKGRLVQRVYDVPKERIDRAKKAAKQGYIWASDYVEKAKAAAIKNACKHIFASLQGLQDIIDYDNNSNYDVGKPMEGASPVRKTILDNVNETVNAEAHSKASPAPEEVPAPPPNKVKQAVVVEAEYVDAPEPEPELTAEAKKLILSGDKAATGGRDIYMTWIGTLADSDKDLIRFKHPEWQKIAKAVVIVEADTEEPPI